MSLHIFYSFFNNVLHFRSANRLAKGSLLWYDFILTFKSDFSNDLPHVNRSFPSLKLKIFYLRSVTGTGFETGTGLEKGTGFETGTGLETGTGIEGWVTGLLSPMLPELPELTEL